MGLLRDKMTADLALAGYCPATRSHYLRCIRAFARHFMRPPEDLGTPEVRAFLLHLVEERKLSGGRFNQYMCALKFLYGVTLGRPDVMEGLRFRKHRQTPPDALTRDEVLRVLAAAPSAYWRTFFLAGYATGLRRFEVAALRAEDIDAASGLLRVAHVKGDKPRVVMLDPTLLAALRAHWRTECLPGPWLFPARAGRLWANHPVLPASASDAFRVALAKAAIGRRVTLHGLRHAFATHCLEDGTDVITLQKLLGHSSVVTTARYAQVRTDQIRRTPSPLSKLQR